MTSPFSTSANPETVDAEYTVSYDDEPTAPEWRIWLGCGRDKAREAWRSLDYLGHRSRLYWYRDRRTGAVYQLPDETTFQIWQTERRLYRLKALKHRTLAKALLWASVLPLLLGATSTMNRPSAPATVILIVGLLLMLVGISLYRGQQPTPLPSYRLWVSDAEWQDRARARRNRTILYAIIVTVWAAHAWHRHEQHEQAEAIADALDRRGL